MNITRALCGFFQRTPHVPLKGDRDFHFAYGGMLDGEKLWTTGEQPIHGEQLEYDSPFAVHLYSFDSTSQAWKLFDVVGVEEWRRFTCGRDVR